MNVTLVARPAATRHLAGHLSWPSCPAIVGRRHESSFRRTKQRLRVKPDPSFTLTKTSPQQDHIIFNPPSSAPSVYHTPHKFLPKDDRRRDLLSPSRPPASSARVNLPPPVRKQYQKKYHLTEEDLDEIRRLRKEDPVKWSREKLSKKFNCSSLFVGIVCEASKAHKEVQLQKLDAVKAKWGRRKSLAREDRTRRRESWGRDEDLDEGYRELKPSPTHEKAQSALAELQHDGDGR